MVNLSRRGFGAALAALPLSAALAKHAAARSTGPLARPPVVARYQIGRFEVTVISDGYIDFPYDLFTGAAPADVKAAGDAVFAAGKNGIRASFSTYLINDGERYILVDSGPAGTVSADKRDGSPARWKALGVAASSIDAVILSHAHVDHIAGMVAGGRQQLSQCRGLHRPARYRDLHRSRPCWHVPPQITHSSFAATEQLVVAVPALAADRWQPRDFARGVGVRPVGPHTGADRGQDRGWRRKPAVGRRHAVPSRRAPGHPRLWASSSRWTSPPPMPPAPGSLPKRPKQKALIAATHMPFPGVGRIVGDAGALRWLPADWSYL